MATLYVLQTGRTVWEEQARIDSAAGVPLAEDGVKDVTSAAHELLGREIGALYACDGEAERQTAELVAEQLGLKIRVEPQLRELDYGLWQGLTIDEVKRRHAKLYRHWLSAPASVCPPGGETVAEAQERLRSAVKGILRRQKDGSVLLILRPVALGLLRCLVAGADADGLWEYVNGNVVWDRYEIDVDSL